MDNTFISPEEKPSETPPSYKTCGFCKRFIYNGVIEIWRSPIAGTEYEIHPNCHNHPRRNEIAEVEAKSFYTKTT